MWLLQEFCDIVKWLLLELIKACIPAVFLMSISKRTRKKYKNQFIELIIEVKRNWIQKLHRIISKLIDYDEWLQVKSILIHAVLDQIIKELYEVFFKFIRSWNQKIQSIYSWSSLLLLLFLLPVFPKQVQQKLLAILVIAVLFQAIEKSLIKLAGHQTSRIS